jgi:glycosyltransferase involved in cell wall biosynthesis
VFVGADDARKNESGLLEAFAQLPGELRRRHPLHLVGQRSPETELRNLRLRRRLGLQDSEVVLTGRLTDDELAALYRRSRVVVMPSFAEGLGLPVLEAWAFGTPVVASDRSSLPELVTDQEARFDPSDSRSMARVLGRVLTDDEWWGRLRGTGTARATMLGWDDTAERVVTALHGAVERRRQIRGQGGGRRSLALVTPWRPQVTGVARHAEVMHDALSRHYDVTVVTLPTASRASGVRFLPPDAFLDRAGSFDRVLYEVGNSPFHDFMVPLLRQVPGVVALHDARLDAWLRYSLGPDSDALGALAYREGGIRAWRQGELAGVEIVRSSLGLLVHSERAAAMLTGHSSAIPASLVRVAPMVDLSGARPSRADARRRLGLRPDDVLIATFGRVHPAKRTREVLEAAGRVARTRPHVRVAAVGADADDAYTGDLREEARRTGATVTGDVPPDAYAAWVAASDIAVQLRADDNGETSAALIEAMAGGACVVAEDIGSLGETLGTAGVLVPSPPGVGELSEVLAALVDDPQLRARLGSDAARRVEGRHDVRRAADVYCEVIEEHYRRRDPRSLVEAVGAATVGPERRQAALRAAAANRRDRSGNRLVLDVSELLESHDVTGIQRVELRLAQHLPDVWPGRLLHADATATGLRETLAVAARTCRRQAPVDWPLGRLAGSPGDWLLSGRFFPDADAWEQQLAAWRATGGRVAHVVYDLLPITDPQWFPPSTVDYFPRYLDVVLRHSDVVLSISQATQDALVRRLGTHPPPRRRPPRLARVRLGADLATAPPAAGHDSSVLGAETLPTVLMVGTVEPRKGHRDVVAAFRTLWGTGARVRLVVVGRPGWGTAELHRDLERAARDEPLLEWRRDVDDAELCRLYQHADLLLAASEGEGFGIPLMEAAHFGLPVLARDIAVFREVMGDAAAYFTDGSPAGLAKAIESVLREPLPRTTGLGAVSWETTAQDVVAALRAAGSRGAAWVP